MLVPILEQSDLFGEPEGAPTLDLAIRNGQSVRFTIHRSASLRRSPCHAAMTPAAIVPSAASVNIGVTACAAMAKMRSSTRYGHTIFVPNGQPPNLRAMREWPPIIRLHKLVELFSAREAA